MRKMLAAAAVMSMALAPMAPLAAQDYHETGDIYSYGDASGPSFNRSTHCAAMFAISLDVVEGDGADQLVKMGSAWLKWAAQIAQGRDAEGSLNEAVVSFKQGLEGYSPEDASAELSKEIQGCQAHKNMFAGLQPFTSVYNASITGEPNFFAATTCIAIYSSIAEIIGKEDKNQKFYTKGVDLWSDYAVKQVGGDDQVALSIATPFTTDLTNELVALLTNDSQAGFDRLAAERDNCIALEGGQPKVFKNRKPPT